MLIFGASGSDWKEKAAYALDKAENEFAKVREIRCDGVDDVYTALSLMAAYASDSRCQNFLYHATLNLYRGERLTLDQWKQSIDLLEKNLGLEGHDRIAFEHIKNNRQHYHVYWSRLPVGGNGPAVNMGNNYRVHEVTAAMLEREFGLKPSPRRGKDRISKERQEIRDKNADLRDDPDAVSRDVTRIYWRSHTTPAFIENLSREGYALTRSKKNKLVLVDKNGGYHGLLRRIDGIRAKDLKDKLPALDKTPLPSLSDVLNGRRQKPKAGFKRMSAVVGKRIKIRTPRVRTTSFRVAPPKPISALVVQARRYLPKEKKNYPQPVMRKRKRRKPENELPRPIIDLKAIENAELLAWAWENHRPDILRDFGIILPPDYFEP